MLHNYLHSNCKTGHLSRMKIHRLIAQSRVKQSKWISDKGDTVLFVYDTCVCTDGEIHNRLLSFDVPINLAKST